MTTILPCPFCGHENVEIDEVGIGEFAVDCPECLAIGPIAGDIMSAIAQYNGALQRLPNVSVTPAGGGDISPAAANRSTSLAKNSGEVAAVVEPPKPEASPAKAGSDEIANPNHHHHGATMKQIEIPPLDDGETYVGCIGDAKGNLHHVILLPGDNDDAAWQSQIEWAKSIGGDLPNRIELAMPWPITAISSRETCTGATRRTTPSPVGLGISTSATATSTTPTSTTSSALVPSADCPFNHSSISRPS